MGRGSYLPPKIVQGGDKRVLWLLALLIVVVAGWSIYVFDYGRHWAGFDVGRWLRMRASLESRVEHLEAELQTARLAAAKYERAAQIESEAAAKVQVEFKTLRNENAELKRQIELMRSLVAQGKGPLFIRDFSLTQGGGPNEVNYRFSVVQVRKNVGSTKGVVEMRVEGRLKKENKTLELAALTKDKRESIALDFRHYQDIRGTLVLPKDFEAKSLVVEIRPKSRKLKRVKQVYDWSLKKAGN